MRLASPPGPRPRRLQALAHVRHEAGGERGVPSRAVRGGAPPEHGPDHRVHERARVPVPRAGQVAVRGARHCRRDGVRGVECARRVHGEQRHGGVGAVPQASEPSARAADGLGLGGQTAPAQRELLRGAVHQVRGVLVGAHLQRALQTEPARLGGGGGRPRAVRGAAHSLRQAQRPLQVVRGRALRDRGRGVHRAADAGGDEFRPISGFGFLKCLGVPRLGQPLGGVVVAAAAAQAPLRELHVVEQLPVAHGEARGAAARLALRELGKRRQRVEVGGHRARCRDPPPLHRLQEPPEHFAHARRAGGTRHGEERLGERAALAAAQAAARTQALHLVRETLEVRVEHLWEKKTEGTERNGSFVPVSNGQRERKRRFLKRCEKRARFAATTRRVFFVGAARFRNQNRRPLRRTAGRRFVGRLGEAAARGELSRGSIRRTEWMHRTAI